MERVVKNILNNLIVTLVGFEINTSALRRNKIKSDARFEGRRPTYDSRRCYYEISIHSTHLLNAYYFYSDIS